MNRTFLALAAALIAAAPLAACTQAIESQAPSIAPPAPTRAFDQQQHKPRLVIPSESVGKGYVPKVVRVRAPAEHHGG